MAKRMLEATPAQLAAASGRDLYGLIAAAEGRTIMCEVVAERRPAVPGVTNAELAAALGADLILLNGYDTAAPVVAGLPAGPSPPLLAVRQLVGRAVGTNLEPVGEGHRDVAAGRRATAEAVAAALEQGAQFILVTGNPGTGVTNAAVAAAVRLIRAQSADVLVLAGKMHAAGVPAEAGPALVTPAVVAELLAAGADVVLLPAPGTVPGFTVERVAGLVDAAHAHGGLAATAVGTCQEGSDEATVGQVALAAKMAGADLHHLGDCGWAGVAPPENIYRYGLAIRGRVHTYRRMAMSLYR